MTSSEPMTTRQMCEELMSRMNVMEQLQMQKESIIATAVMETLKEEGVISEYVQRIVEKIEAEWTGAFLPDLRAQILSRLEELESIVLPGGNSPTAGS